jgi:hypothetical protein
MSRQRKKMNRKVLAAAVALLMILSTILMAVPVNAIISPLPVINNASGATCSQQTITAPGAGVLVTSLTPAHEVFVMFDKEVADADLGLPLYSFGAVTVPVGGIEKFVHAAGFPANVYTPGDPIYVDLPDAGVGFVSVGDVRETPVTVGANNYLAGSTVAAGDADIAVATVLTTFTAISADYYAHTAVSAAAAAAGFNWANGDGIYIRDAASGTMAVYPRVGPGDLRARYPSVTVTLPSATMTYTYAAWTKVKSPVLDFHKYIYVDTDLSGTVTAGDLRRSNVVFNDVTYLAGSIVRANDRDIVQLAAPVLAAFVGTEAFNDANNNGVWNSGEFIYTVAGVFTGAVKIGDTRRSYVVVSSSTYLPNSLVAPGDADIGLSIGNFPAAQSYYNADGAAGYDYGDWIYNQAGLIALAAGTVRASAVDFTDKSMASTGILSAHLPAVWVAPAAGEWENVFAYPFSGAAVAAFDLDVGRTLSAFATTDHHTGGAAYARGDTIFRDNDGDNFISVGDTRESLIWNALARTYAGAYPWPVAAAPFYLPGTNILATDVGTALGTALFPFAANERYYDPFNDGAYVGSDLMSVMAGSNDVGNAMPFTTTSAAGTGVQANAVQATSLPISFAVPANAPIGNHAVFVITDEPAAMAAPFANAGFDASAAFPAGGGFTIALDSLPWTGDSAVAGPPARRWRMVDFGSQAGPAFFAVISKGCAVQMSPGAYAHALGTPASIVKLDYPKGAVIQNSTGDISLTIILCSEVSSIAIYIPPEFTFLRSDTTSVWSSITNDYSRISIGKLGSSDPIGPSWWSVRITSYIAPGNYAVKLFNVQAPEVCSRYFVKVFIDGESIGAEDFPTIVVKGGLYPAYISGRVLNANSGQYGEPVGVSGKVVVEGKTALGEAIQGQAYFDASANGAYTIYGLAAGTYNLTASAAGFVPETLDRTISVDAGQSLEGVDIYLEPSPTISGTICSKCGVGAIPWGSAASHRISVELLDSNLRSIGFLATNATNVDPSQPYYPFSFPGTIDLDGHVPQDHADYVSGLAVGDYYLKAYVNGYLQRDVVAVHVYDYSRIISVPFDLWRSSQFSVTVHFVDVGGSASPTPQKGTLLLEAFGLDGGIEGYNTTSVPENSASWTMTIIGKNNGLPSGTYFIEATFPGYSQAFYPQATLGGGCSTTSLSFDMVRSGLLNITLRSINWQTPPQNVLWGYPNATIRIEAIGSQQIYSGTASQENAMVSGKTLVGVTFANITDLPPDTYLIRAYTVGYVQTKDYQVSMSFGGTSDIQIDLIKATRLNVTLTFRKESLVAPIDTYARYNSNYVPVRVELFDSSGVLAGATATQILTNPPGLVWPSVEVAGFESYAGNPTVRWVNYYDATDGSRQDDYGLPPGTYQVFVWVPGYVQAQPATFTATLSAANVTLDLYFDRLAHVNGTVGGLDMYDNLIPLSWATVSAYGPTLVTTSSLDGVYEMWIPNGNYTLGVSHPGYQAQGVQIQVSMAWETSVDFNLTPAGTTTPELPTTGITLPVVLAMACAACYLHVYRRRTPG